MANRADHYRTLSVDPTSEDVVIQAAYRALMRRYHPDTNKSAEAVARAQAINTAYAILSDPEKRRAYDRNRCARSGAATGSTPPPPPPPRSEPKPSPAAAKPPDQSTDHTGSILTYGSIAAICILAIVTANNGQSASADNTMNVDETMTTENVVWGDTTAIDGVTTVDANFSTNAADANLMVPSKVSLATASQQSVKFDNIESAANRFASILMNGGMAGARAYSTRCHEKVVDSPNWNGADYCAAFDYAAAYIDRQISSQERWIPNSYFKFQSDNQDDNYFEAGAPRYSVVSRLISIKKAAEAAATEAVQLEIAKSDARRAKEQSELQANSARNAELSAAATTNEGSDEGRLD